MIVRIQRNDARFWHPVAIDEDFTCIDCHKGIAHQLPGLDSLIEEAGSEFWPQLSDDRLSADQIYAIDLITLYKEAKEGAKPRAQITPGTKLQVIERSADWLKVVVNGEALINDEQRLDSDTVSGVVSVALSIAPVYLRDEAIIDPETRLS
jgi:hypothetical protein